MITIDIVVLEDLIPFVIIDAFVRKQAKLILVQICRKNYKLALLQECCLKPGDIWVINLAYEQGNLTRSYDFSVLIGNLEIGPNLAQKYTFAAKVLGINFLLSFGGVCPIS